MKTKHFDFLKWGKKWFQKWGDGERKNQDFSGNKDPLVFHILFFYQYFRREVSLNGLMTQSLIDLKQSNTNISQISDHILLSNNKVAQDKEKQSSLSSSFHGLVENWPRKHSNPHCDDNVNCGVNGGEGASLHHVTSALNAKTTPTVRKPKPPPPPIRTTPLTAHPPPLPPKGTGEGIQPPPRPRSKELKLDDVLQLCEEYEKQIEQEQIMAKSLR